MKTRKVETLPGKTCDLCKKENLTVIIDAPTKIGPWAHMCEACYKCNGNEPATKFVKQKKVHKEYTEEQILEHAQSVSEEELGAMMFDGDVEAIDGCIVDPDGECCHGYPSPLLTLGMI